MSVKVKNKQRVSFYNTCFVVVVFFVVVLAVMYCLWLPEQEIKGTDILVLS